jgi:hypothetical protein
VLSFAYYPPQPNVPRRPTEPPHNAIDLVGIGPQTERRRAVLMEQPQIVVERNGD